MRSGIPSLYMPASTGNTPVMTDATGATIPMRPMAERLVQRCDAEWPQQYRRLRPTIMLSAVGAALASNPDQQKHEQQAACVCARDNAKDIGPLGGDAASEIASAPDGRGAQAETRAG